jgi:hypothetical protein
MRTKPSQLPQDQRSRLALLPTVAYSEEADVNIIGHFPLRMTAV